MNFPIGQRRSLAAVLTLSLAVFFPDIPAAWAQTPGSIDTTFNLFAGGDAQARFLAVRGDRRILAVGDLTVLNNEPRKGLGLLSAEGQLEPAVVFEPAGAVEPFAVHCLALQRDGKMVIGGHFMVARRLRKPRPCISPATMRMTAPSPSASQAPAARPSPAIPGA